jgi:hypothetical protein
MKSDISMILLKSVVTILASLIELAPIAVAALSNA